jgi:hypothetical protein
MNPQVTVTRRNTLFVGTTLAALPALGSQTLGLAPSPANAQTAPTEFARGFPTYETIERLCDEADLNRAIQTYKFFYPSISMTGFADGFEKFSPVNNKTFFILSAAPNQIFFTANSDTPYAALPLDLTVPSQSSCLLVL